MYTYIGAVPETNTKDLRSQLKEEEVAMKSPLALVRLLDRALLNRHQSKKLKSSRARFPQRPNFSLEPLEDRLLLSVGLIGIPDWVEQGPAVTINGQVAGLAGPDPVVGAIEAIAPHPTDANTILVGTVAGGIWRTTDGGTTWTFLTDQWPSLSSSAIAYSPLDTTNNTLFAGTGSFSSGGNGGPAVGALRTTDGGNSWVPIGSEFSGQRVRSIVPTSIGASLTDQVVLVATVDGGGVYRSVNGGATFSLISGTSGATDGLDNNADGTTDERGELNLQFGSPSHLVRDPGNVNRFYTAIPGQGIFRSDNGGANWVQVNTGLTNVSATIRIELSVSAAAGNPIYAALINLGTTRTDAISGALASVFRSADQGTNWTAVGVAPAINPGDQGGFHFSILADNVAPNIVYVGGDRQAGVPFVGNLFRGDSTANTWTSIVLGGAGGTAPHADSRDMVFDVNGAILQSDDAGIYRLINPKGPGTKWQSLPSMPRVAQFTNIGYDQLNNTILGGTQDTGSPEQVSGFNWRDLTQADGGFVAVDNDQVAHPGTTLHYSSSQFLGGFNRRTLDNTNRQIGATAEVGLMVTGAGGKLLISSTTVGMTTYRFDSTIQFLQPYVLNSITPSRMLIGTDFLYESTNNGNTLTALGGLNNLNTDTLDNDLDGATDEGDEYTAAGAIGTVSAMVYGGRSGGVNNADLIYVASGTTLRLRTANTTNSLTDFTNVAGYRGASITDIEIDPDDWTRGYVLDSSERVFRFQNSGATTDDWTNVTGSLATLTDDARDVELYTPTTEAGDDFLLVSGFGGVFRTLTPSADSVWTEFGGNLPNVVVTDLVYDAVDDALVAGTYGRGAWTIASASTAITQPAVLQITGDDQDDTVRLVRDANNPSLLNVFDNGVRSQHQISTLQQIDVFGLGGNDTLIVDSSHGLINVGNGIRFDGDGGTDGLQLLQTGVRPYVSDTYSVGPATGTGISTIMGGIEFGTQTVSSQNLDAVLDLVPTSTLTVNATPEDNAINYTDGTLVTHGKVTIDAHESIEFANKTALELNAGAGIDRISLNNAGTPTGLTGITVNGSDPNDGDTLSVTGVGSAVTVNTLFDEVNGATGADGLVDINYGGIESLNLLAGIGALTFNTTEADDMLEVTPGASASGSNSGTLQSNGVAPSVSFANSGAVTANLDDGNDSVLVNGSSSNDTVAVSGVAINITGRHEVSYADVEAVSVNGQAGSDIFHVKPAAGVSISIDGDAPIGTAPGDQLNILAGGQSVTYNAGPQPDEGSFAVGANQPVSFDHIESFRITGSGRATINGTNGPDAITVIARDSSTHAGTNGVRDFTVSVNTGPELLFVGMSRLAVNGLRGSDHITLRAPAPNNAVWDVDVTVNGGTSAADADRLIVQTPGARAETVAYTPKAANGGTLNLTSLSSLITLTSTEALRYDGQRDNDSLKIVGTGRANTIVHTPGSTDQAGRFQVNSLLALTYQNLGGRGRLTADGAGGNDTLVYNGRAVNDRFSIGAAGQVNLNSRLVVNTARIETLTLQGLGGDDTFTLVPALSASVYSAINLNGGAQASATGDRAILTGTTGADNVKISGQVVSLGGKTVKGSGLEGIRFDARAGNDLLTYNGVRGVTENITVSSSGVVGGGRISGPNVTRVDFSGVQRIDVNGNAPRSTETDTLAFRGTNAADVFQINLAAAGSDADPILKLQNAAATQTLLTLRNYTNFNTLRVLGLDGEDTFNVKTAPVNSRNLFVDGGQPTSKEKSIDTLNVVYAPPRPRIIQSPATQDPDAGRVDLNYGAARFLVQYDDIERVTIRRS